ncbi:unnamed protein product [Camellia sinensis]
MLLIYSMEMEKRQLFLRSYQFCRKKSVAERIKGSFFRVKRVVWSRFRSARKIRKIVWFRLRYGLFYSTTKRNFLRLHNPNTTTTTSWWSNSKLQVIVGTVAFGMGINKPDGL